MKSLTLKRLEEDKKKLEITISKMEMQINQLTSNHLRYLGALGYIEDNIKQIKEVEDAGRGNNS